MSLSQPLIEPGTDVSRFRVEDLVARGGMGLVYRARDLRLDRPVALKVLAPELSDDEEFRQRFVRECRLAAALDHPHVVPVYEADEWHGLLYVAMRFVHGADLASVLRGGPLPLPTALVVLAQAASALDAAHDAGLVHRDVKPGNLLVSGASPGHVPEKAHLYLTDFGLTKQAGSLSGLTRSGTFLGSLHYVAPEQIQAEDVDGRADLYSLACVAYELLSGVPPFRRDQEAALLWAHMSVEPPALTDVRPDLPAAMAAVLARGMAKDREDRPATCGRFAADLREAAGPGRSGALRAPAAPTAPVVAAAGPTVVGRAATPVALRRKTPVPVADVGVDGPAPAPPSRRRWLLPAAGLAVLVAVVAGLLVWSPWAEDGGSGGSGTTLGLAQRSLEAAPYTAELPADWSAYPVPDGSIRFGPDDLAVVPLDDESSVDGAAAVASDEPERLVAVHVRGDTGLGNEAPADVPGQVAAGLPAGTVVRAGAMTSVGEQDALRLTGEVPLDEDTSLRVVGVAVGDDVLLLCVAPESVFDEWEDTFDVVVDSLAPG